MNLVMIHGKLSTSASLLVNINMEIWALEEVEILLYWVMYIVNRRRKLFAYHKNTYLGLIFLTFTADQSRHFVTKVIRQW